MLIGTRQVKRKHPWLGWEAWWVVCSSQHIHRVNCEPRVIRHLPSLRRVRTHLLFKYASWKWEEKPKYSNWICLETCYCCHSLLSPSPSWGIECVWSGLSQLHYPWSTRWVVPGLESQHSRLGSVAVGSAHLTIAGLDVDVAVWIFNQVRKLLEMKYDQHVCCLSLKTWNK